MTKLTIFICLLLANCCISAKLPLNFVRCNRYERDFNQCLKIAVEDAIRQLNRPIGYLGLNSLEPLEVSSFTVDSTRSVKFPQNLKNFRLFGLSNINLLDLEMNFENKTLYMDCLFPEIIWEFDFDFDGALITTPIKGTGPGLVYWRNVRYKLTFTLDEYEKKGKKYFKVAGVECEMDPGRAKVKLDSLSGEDKALDKAVNVLNDNWRNLFREVKSGYEDAFGKIFSILFDRFLVNVPIKELFETETSRLVSVYYLL